MTLMLLAVAWLLTYLVHSTILLTGAAVLCALKVIRSHEGRDVLWKVAVLGGLVSATAQLALPLMPRSGIVALRPIVESPVIEARAAGPLLAPAAAPARVAEPAGDFASVALFDSPRRLGSFHAGWPGVVLNFWLFGALACCLGLFWARADLRRRLAGRRDIAGGPLSDTLAELRSAAGVSRPVRLTVSAAISGPISFGRAEICLPERVLSDLSPAEQRAVLAHELGHLVRRDPAWQLAGAVIAAVLFLQPLNRLARRRLMEIAEYLCDDWAAARSGGGLVMAQCLAEVARWMRPGPELRVAPALAARPSQLVARVERLVQGSGRGAGRRSRLGVLALGVGAMGLVAWSAPGVAARDLPEPPPVASAAQPEPVDEAIRATLSSQDGDGWLSVRGNGRLLVLHPRYTARLTGQGRLGFRQWGRALRVAEGYRVTVDGALVSDDTDVCADQAVRIVAPSGAVAWTLQPVRRAARQTTLADTRRRLRDLGEQGAEADLDAAIDTLVRAWAEHPEALRAAAQRLARTFEDELAPQFESLGVALGRELAPRLERVSDRLGRDLGPEFARLGAELGRTIARSFAETELRPSVEPGAGSGDFRTKPRPKHR